MLYDMYKSNGFDTKKVKHIAKKVILPYKIQDLNSPGFYKREIF